MDGVGLSSRERLCESARPAASARPGAARACAMRQALQGGSGGAPPCPVALGELESPSVKAAFATHKHFPHTYTVVLLPSSSTSPPSELRPSQYRSGSVLDLVSTRTRYVVGGTKTYIGILVGRNRFGFGGLVCSHAWLPHLQILLRGRMTHRCTSGKVQ